MIRWVKTWDGENVQGKVCSRAEGWETGIFEVLVFEDPRAAFVVCKHKRGSMIIHNGASNESQ